MKTILLVLSFLAATVGFAETDYSVTTKNGQSVQVSADEIMRAFQLLRHDPTRNNPVNNYDGTFTIYNPSAGDATAICAQNGGEVVSVEELGDPRPPEGPPSEGPAAGYGPSARSSYKSVTCR